MELFLDVMFWKRPRRTHFLLLRGVHSLLLFYLIVRIEGDDNTVIENRSFGLVSKPRHISLPLHARKHRQPAQGQGPPSPPTSFTHMTRGNGKTRGDMTSAAQTLYDLRGFHIPLGGAQQTQHFIQNQNHHVQPQSQPLRQSPLVFPSFFQPQNQPYFVNSARGHQEVSDFGQIKSQQPLSLHPGTRLLAPNPTNFRPSNPDLGKSTTEDTFKPFNPPGLTTSKEESPKSQYIYVYDVPDYDVEATQQPIRVKETEKSTTTAPQTVEANPSPLPAYQYQYYDEDRNTVQPNNVPFSGFVDDHRSNPENYPGHHFTTAPNVEIVPSSERKPPPDAPNTIRATLKEAKPQPQPQPLEYEEFTVGPSFDLETELKQTNLNRPASEAFPQPYKFEPVPTNSNPGKNQRSQNIIHPVQPVSDSDDNEEEYEEEVDDKMNTYVEQPMQPSQPPRQVVPQNTANIEESLGNVLLEEIPTTARTTTSTTTISTTTTTATTTRQPPSTTNLRTRGRSHFPPYSGRSNLTTSTTTASTITSSPSHRTSRLRLRTRPTTTATTTTSTAPPPPPLVEMDFYEVVDPNQQVENHNSIEQHDQQRINPEPILIDNVRNRERQRNSARAQNPGRVRGQGHVRDRPKSPVQELHQPRLTFRDARAETNRQNTKVATTPITEQQAYEPKSSVQIRTRTRPNQLPRTPNPVAFVPLHPPQSPRQARPQPIPEFVPFPEPPRQDSSPFQQIPPRGRKEPPAPAPSPPRIQHNRNGGKPLYISGKMLEKEGGLYAGFPIRPEHHGYGYGPLEFVPVLEFDPVPPPPPLLQEPLHVPQPRHRERSQGRQQQRHSKQILEHQSEVRGVAFAPPPSPTVPVPRPTQEITVLSNALSSPGSEVDSQVPPSSKIRGRVRLIDPARRRKFKPEPISNPEQAETSDSVVNSRPRNRYQYDPSTTAQPPTTTFYTPPIRETSPPSQLIELPPTPKPNPLKGRPVKRIRVPGPFTTTTTTTVAPTPEDISTSSPAIHRLRPRPRFLRPFKELEPAATQSVQISRKPNVPSRFSSKYTSSPIPTEPETILAETVNTQSPPEPQPTQFALPPQLPKSRPKVKVKKPKPTEEVIVTVAPFTVPPFTVAPLIVREIPPSSTLPASILLSPKDVIQNRKPARRIPPGSASDKLKALQERRRKLFKSRVLPGASSQEDDANSGAQDYDGEVQEPLASNSDQVQSKREIRVLSGNNGNSSQNLVTVGPKPLRSNSKEKTAVRETQYHLFWEAVETTVTPVPKVKVSPATIPAPVIEFDSYLDDDQNPLQATPSSVDSPFSVFRLSNERPTLPLEAEFFQPFPSAVTSNRIGKKSNFKL